MFGETQRTRIVCSATTGRAKYITFQRLLMQMDRDECVPEVDFSTGSFTNPREPLKDLITTFSDSYIDSESEASIDDDFHHLHHLQQRERHILSPLPIS